MRIKTNFRKATYLALASVFGALTITSALPPVSVSAATITVNSPANGQQFTGNSFTITGVADANATIVLIRNGLTVAQAHADGSGNWSTQLSNLPDGNNTITARSIKNTGYGYFLGSTDGGTTVKIHRLKLSDNTIDGAAYPYTATSQQILLVPSPANNYFYQTGSFGASIDPGQFNANAPASPVSITSYPANASAGVGAFSADGTKYYSPNSALSTISVVDVASNTITSTINLSIGVTQISLTPGGLLYANAAGGSHDIQVVDTANNTVKKTFTAACPDNNAAVTTTSFSQDVAYPYYYVFCVNNTTSGSVLKYSTSTDQLISTWNVDHGLSNGVLTLDNSKFYTTSSSAIPNNTGSDKIYVLDTSTGAITKTIQMHAGLLGIFQSPDAQHIYAGTIGNNFDQTGIDIVDTTNNDSVEHIADGTGVTVLTASSVAATESNVNVSVVLGVKTTAGSLANTGAFAVSSTILAGLLVASLTYTYWDYRRHKQPLVAVDPDARHTYTYLHHVKVVTIPLLKYRVNVSFARNTGSDAIHRF